MVTIIAITDNPFKERIDLSMCPNLRIITKNNVNASATIEVFEPAYKSAYKKSNKDGTNRK
jgi:hypothetical protein